MPASPSSLGAGSEQDVEVIAASAVTTSGSGAAKSVLADWEFATAILKVTAVTGVVGDSLNVYLQQRFDGANWDDLVAYPQILGNTTTYLWSASLAIGRLEAVNEVHAQRVGTLAAGTVANINLARVFRADYVIVGTGTWTFSLSMHFRRRETFRR